MHNKSSSYLASPNSKSLIKSSADSLLFSKSQINFSQNSTSLHEINSPNKSAISQSLQIDFCLEQIEKDIKALDQSFGFQWDEELSLIFAVKCIKQATQKLKLLKESILDQSQEKPALLFLKLKKLEINLSLREKMITESEQSQNEEKKRLENERKQIEDQKTRIKEEKKMIEDSWGRIQEENGKVAINMKKLDKKYEMIMETLNTINSKSLENLEQASNDEAIEAHNSPDNHKSQNQDLKRLQEQLAYERTEVHQMKLDLQQERSQYEAERKEFIRMRKEFQEISEKSFNVQKELLQSPKASKTSEILEAQLIEITNLKKNLIHAQEQCFNEHQSLKQEYSKKLEDLLNSHKTLKCKFEELAAKEKALESFSSDLENEKLSFQSLISISKSSEKMRESYETLQSSWEDLQSEYCERSKMLEVKENLIKTQEKSLNCVLEANREDLMEIYSDIKVRLQEILEEESQVLKIQRHAVKVKKENEITAELLKTIHEELIQHQSYLEAEHEKLKDERKQVEIIFFKLENQAKNLEIKEGQVLDSMKQFRVLDF